MSRNKSSHSQFGFTLIEMMVSITIMLMLIGGGIAGYLSFNDKRIVLNAVDEIKTELQVSQSLANSGRLGGCTKLDGYRVLALSTGGDTNVTVSASCMSGSSDGSQDHTTTLENVTVSFNILYQVLSGSACLDGTCAASPPSINITVTHPDSSGQYQFQVTESGEITQGAWL